MKAQRLLFVKLTSLGDLIHALPALTDAICAIPELKVDWVIDENFSEVASWHKAIDKIYTTNHRQWRKGIFSSLVPIRALIKSLRETHYDLILDGQGNFKTGLISLCMKGTTAGFDRQSVREPIASFAYDKKYSAAKKMHAVDRLRTLFALSLGYPLPTSEPDFAIMQERFVKPNLELPESYLVFIHNASWKTKLWPEGHWKKLIEMAGLKGHTVLLPWGNKEEKERAERLALGFSHAKVLPKLSLSEIGYILARAKGCVCMDTGLSHLTAALNIPAVTLYGATDSGLIGTSGQNQRYLQSTLGCAPCNKKHCSFPGADASFTPPCLGGLSPEKVLAELELILSRPALNICNR